VRSSASLTGPNGTVALAVDTSASTATQTIVTLTFSGAGTQFGSLADGRYTLRILANQVLDANGAPLDGDANGLAGDDQVTGLHRLFGDTDGDGDIDAVDNLRFRQAFGTTLPP
jgi:hypothetical protein